MLIAFPGADRFSAPNRAAAVSPHLQQVRAYWEALRENGLPPRRSQISPRGIEGALSGVFVLERVAPRVSRFRIAGSLLTDLCGCDPRGMPLLVLFDPRGRNQLADEVEQVFTGPNILDLRLEAERGIGRPALDAQALILPLRNDDGVTDLALGCIAVSTDPGHRSRRFFAASTVRTPLVLPSAEPSFTPARPWPEAKVAEPLPMVEGFAEPPATFAPIAPVKAQRSYLRLVHDADAP